MTKISSAQKWFESLPGDDSARFTGPWNDFNGHSSPVITLFGSYDTGKSSLLRRVLVDAGQPVPAWLTISARHETFESNTAEIDGCLIRDTPGFAVGAQDARGQSNSARAMESIGLTDVAVAVLTPQLATSDKELLQALLSRDWPAGSLWFVVSRFDEAGADPEYDLAGYSDLRDRKTAELREAFGLSEDVPVFVVAQDPFQEAGPDAVLATAWDKYRTWDGMDTFSAQLSKVSGMPLADLREAAADRYWKTALSDTLTELHRELAFAEESSSVAANGVARRDAWQSELDSIDSAAIASLDGLVASVVDQALSSPLPPTQGLDKEIETSLTTWFTQHDVHLQRLQRSISKAIERDHRQPAWTGFESLVSQLHASRTIAQPPAGVNADRVAEAGGHVLNIMHAMAAVQMKNGSDRGMPNKIAEGIGKYVPAAEAALPLAVFVATQIDASKPAGAGQQGPPSATARQNLIDTCTKQAHQTWEDLVAHTRSLITTETSDQVALDDELRETVARLKAAIESGERIANS